MNKPLYALADEYLAIAKAMVDLELPDEVISDTLEGASGEIEEKAWNVAAMILQFEGETDMVRAAEKRMTARRKSLENRVEWMRQYLLSNLLVTGISEVSSPEFVVIVCECPPRAVLDDEDAIPNAFKVEETIISVRKDEVRKAMLDGEIIPGAHLERGRRLSIK